MSRLARTERQEGAGERVLVGLLGEGIGASRTPRMHMAEGAALGFSYEYRLIDTLETYRDLPVAEVLDRIEAGGFTGINVTYPYKRLVLECLDELSGETEAVGATNAIVFRDGRRIGHNTDYRGFAESFRRGLAEAKRENVLLLGAGGAGGAVANALVDNGTERLWICDPNSAAADALAASINRRLGARRAGAVMDLAATARTADGIVNASPIGMRKLPGLPLPASLVEPRHWVGDIVYFPLETELLALARARGCKLLPGSGMALFQAVYAFELFTGRKPDVERMRATFEAG